MLVRFQRLRVALVAAEMFCVAYINAKEFTLKTRLPENEKSDSQVTSHLTIYIPDFADK